MLSNNSMLRFEFTSDEPGTFECKLDEGTYGITVVHGAYKAERHYYDPVAGTYEIRAGRNVR